MVAKADHTEQILYSEIGESIIVRLYCTFCLHYYGPQVGRLLKIVACLLFVRNSCLHNKDSSLTTLSTLKTVHELN